jgi:tRNA(adenine34) deaminase
VIDNKWMGVALEAALQSGEDVPVGCVLVKDGRLLSSAHNLREQTNDPTAHAEIIAIREAARLLNNWRLEGVTLYTTLEPCPMCAEAILQSRIARVIFGAYDPRSGALGSVFNLFCEGRMYPIPEVIGGIMENQCQTVLKDFFRTRLNRSANTTNNRANNRPEQ